MNCQSASLGKLRSTFFMGLGGDIACMRQKARCGPGRCLRSPATSGFGFQEQDQHLAERERRLVCCEERFRVQKARGKSSGRLGVGHERSVVVVCWLCAGCVQES